MSQDTDQHDEHDDEATESEPQAHAASESGPTTYDQSSWVDDTATGEVNQKPDVVVYGEAGVHHETEWTEPGTQSEETVAKVIRAEEDEQPITSTASTKGGRPERFGRR